LKILPGEELEFFEELPRSIFFTGVISLIFLSRFNYGYSFLSFFYSGGGLARIG
jgi:hypothetical protein